MSISSQLITEKLIENYVKIPFSLKDQTLTKLSIHLCTYSYLKDHIYNPETANRKLFTFDEWDFLLAKQTSTICNKLLPTPLQAPLKSRIHSIAINLLQWNREHQVRLVMPPYGVHELLTPSDWTVEGKINERKVAERIVQNEEISVPMRYELSCLHFLEDFVFDLWNRMKHKHKELFIKYYDHQDEVYESDLVQLWSIHFVSIHMSFCANSIQNMVSFRQFRFQSVRQRGNGPTLTCCLKDRRIGREELIQREDPFWEDGLEIAVKEGRRSAFTYCWNMLSERKKQNLLIICTQKALSKYIEARELRGVTIQMHLLQWNPMPSQFFEIFLFLFSCMSVEQTVEFFLEQPRTYYGFIDDDCTLLLFMGYPYQSYFMPIISKMWGILPESYYGKIILTIARMHIKNMNQENHQDYSYGYFLLELLSETPENYKSYIFSDMSLEGMGKNNVGKELINSLLMMKPFVHKNIEMIRHILQHIPEKEKQSLLFSAWSEDIVKYFIGNKNLEILDYILIDFLREEEIIVFRKQFVLSLKGKKICFQSLAGGNVDLVHSLLNWGHFSKEDVSQFKTKLINVLNSTENLTKLIMGFTFDRLHRVLDWCLPSNDTRKQIKDVFLEYHAMNICLIFLQHSQWSDLMKFLSWAYPSDRALDVFKRELFKNHCGWIVRKMILGSHEEVNFLIEWCDLSSNEITQVKEDAMFSTDVVHAEDYEEKKKLILKMCYQLRDNYLLEIANERLHESENVEVKC